MNPTVVFSLPSRPVQVQLAAEQSENPVSWIQIARTGVFHSPRYGKFEITTTMLGQMVENSKKTENKIVVDYDHLSTNPKNPGDGKAAGWFLDLELRDDGTTLWGSVEWTKEAAEMIRNKEYQYVSPTFISAAMDPDSGENVGAKLIAAAITNHPFLQNMASLSLSGNLAHVISMTDVASISMDERQSRVASAVYDRFKNSEEYAYVQDLYDDYVIIRMGRKLFKESYTISDDLGVTFGGDSVEVVVQYTPVTPLNQLSGGQNMPENDQQMVELRSRLDTVSTQLTELSTALASEREANSALKKELATMKATTQVEALMREGKIAAAQKDWAVEYACSNPSGFATFASTLTPIIKLNTEHGHGDEGGDKKTTANDPVKQLTEAITKYRAENGGPDKVSYSDAMQAVQLSNPELANAYRETLATVVDDEE